MDIFSFPFNGGDGLAWRLAQVLPGWRNAAWSQSTCGRRK
jgi:hypothetical protein